MERRDERKDGDGAEDPDERQDAEAPVGRRRMLIVRLIGGQERDDRKRRGRDDRDRQLDASDGHESRTVPATEWKRGLERSTVPHD